MPSPVGFKQAHFHVLEEDWETIKTYCNRSGKRIYASDFVRVFLAALAADMRKRMEEGQYGSEIDLTLIPPMTLKLMKDLEGE